MSKGKIIVGTERFNLTIERLCHQLIEQYDDFENTCLVGVQTGGIHLSSRIGQRLTELLGKQPFDFGKLDITFYRDDFRTSQKPLQANRTEMDFLVEGKRVLLLDDVLYTGRTIQSALIALNHYGRPKQVELLVMIDRRFNRELPIQADYIGMTVDALDKAYVQVQWEEEEGIDNIVLFA